jgi:DUF177 domain-containing protein
VPPRTDTFDLAQLRLSSGEGAHADLAVPIDKLSFGGQEYSAAHDAEARLDVSRTTGGGYALRLRFDVQLHGPCMRCLEDAGALVEIDAREVDQPGAGEDDDLASPYLTEHELDVRSWARDALVLALPVQIVCSDDCRGLCPVCGENLNKNPDHAHEAEPDPRWGKLSEIKFD